MILGIASVVVVVLIAIALLPAKKRNHDSSLGSVVANSFSRQGNLRQQQNQEEADAIASEYLRRADEVWREELGEKAAALLSSASKPATRKS